MTLAERLVAAWYGTARPPWWTLPLSWLYGMLTALRRSLYRLGVLRSVRLPVPVVVIGNVTVGGTGKTPLTIAVAQALAKSGYQPGVVSRGYGGSQQRPTLLDAVPDPVIFGDEPSLIRASGVLVAVGRERPVAAKLLVDAGCDVVVADDGLQHYALARDIEICVVDGVRRFGNGHLLPAGPLREPLSRLAEVTFVVCNGGSTAPSEIPMELAGNTARALMDDHSKPLSDFTGQAVHAVAAIGNPARFFASLRRSGMEVIEHPFPDHHAFRASDFAFGDCYPVLMTEKDAVKCVQFAQAHWWSVPVRASLPSSFLDDVINLVRKFDRSSK